MHAQQSSPNVLSDIDIIPDIHADPVRLHRSLQLTRSGAKLGFLGDFIDAGYVSPSSDDKAVLHRIKELVTSNQALAVMGNHELNAILFHRLNGRGEPLRIHSPKNLNQHRSFIRTFGIGTQEACYWTDWFLTLPLWLDLGELRLVHACWDAEAIRTISSRRPDGRLRIEDLEEVAAKDSKFAKAVDRLLTGPKVKLPEGYVFHDNSGHARNRVRIAWWRSQATKWTDAALSVPDPSQLPKQPFSGTTNTYFYPKHEPPVFVGHYKMSGVPSVEEAPAMCLDYPSRPCLYQWSGETLPKAENLIEFD